MILGWRCVCLWTHRCTQTHTMQVFVPTSGEGMKMVKEHSACFYRTIWIPFFYNQHFYVSFSRLSCNILFLFKTEKYDCMNSNQYSTGNFFCKMIFSFNIEKKKHSTNIPKRQDLSYTLKEFCCRDSSNRGKKCYRTTLTGH